MTWTQGIGQRGVLTPLEYATHLKSELRIFQNNQTTLPVPLEETSLTSKFSCFEKLEIVNYYYGCKVYEQLSDDFLGGCGYKRTSH